MRFALPRALLVLFFACAFGVNAKAELGFDDLIQASLRQDPTSLADMLAHLDSRAADLEDQADVKCWTSFGQLETFVAGAQLASQTTHLKSEIVIHYLDQVWARAAAASDSGRAVSGDAFESAAAALFPTLRTDLGDRRLRMGDVDVLVPDQDVRDYVVTVEPIRLLRVTTEHVAERDPTRPPLSAQAIEAGRNLGALLSTALLKEANLFARTNRNARIEDADVLAVDAKFAAANGLPLYAPPERSTRSAPGTSDDAATAMLEIVKKKIQSLDTFNTSYAAKNLGTAFDTNLARHETSWAERPVDAKASQLYKEKNLVELATFLYRAAARQHPGSDPLTGPEMLESIASFYPFVSDWFGLTNLFPDHDNAGNYWVREYQADSLRDSAWHWRAFERAVMAAEERKESLPVLDLYAMEELTEFVSVYAVALVHAAGSHAGKRNAEAVHTSDFDRADQLFQANRTPQQAAAEGSRKHDEASREEWAAGADAARKALGESFVKELFTDVTARSGIDFVYEESDFVTRYRFPTAADIERLPSGTTDDPSRIPRLEIGIAGGGVAVADVDGDGLLDVYLVSGKRDRLYRSIGALRFIDATASSGLSRREQGRGAYFVDYDNDGDQDLFVTHVYTPNRLFQNNGFGRFKDVTKNVGLPLRFDQISHSATWFDFDNDGHLDLYVGNFGDWLSDQRPLLHGARNGQPNQLFRANGRGGFEDVTEKTQAGDVGWTHAVSHFDANGDGFQDLYLANDFGRDALLINAGGQLFLDNTPAEQRDRFLHGMSVGFTDADGDGTDDIYVSNIAMFSFISKYIKPGYETAVTLSRKTVQNARMIESNAFLVSDNGSFAESHHAFFDRSAEGAGWAWDADFFDFDNDGEEDLYVVNGREPNLTYDRERNVLFKQHGGRFYDVSRESGADVPSNARGAVHADFDNDGDLDILINNYRDRATLLRNNLRRNNWVQLRLTGTASNRDAIGARVTLHTTRGAQVRTVRGGSGFLSKGPGILGFGLRDTERVDRVEIQWPSGAHQTVADLAINRIHVITEPSPKHGQQYGLRRSDEIPRSQTR